MSMVEVDEPVERAERRVPWPAIGLGAAVVVAAIILLGLIGELGPFLAAGLNVAPFVGLALLAALGEKHGWARWLTYGYVALLNLGIMLVLLALVAIASFGPRVTDVAAVPPGEALTLLRPVLIYAGVGLAVVALTLLPLIPAVRRWFERRLPLRPDSTMNVAGLSAALALAALPLLALIVLNGQPPLLTLIGSIPQTGPDATPAVRPQDQIYGLIWMLPAALVFVGWPIRRAAGSALVRLGLVRPSLRQVALGIGVAVALVVVVLALDPAVARLWEALGWPRTDTKAFEKLMAGLITPLGAVVIGVTAGLGEEVAVRGVLQPRLGMLLANLAFTSAHAVQYSWDGLLVVFLVGLALSVLRARTNTTTSAIAHGVYDFILVFAASAGW